MAGTDSDSSERPNVLVLVSDQHRADAMEGRGVAVSTPNLAKLASEGVEFERAYTPIPLCTPSRQSFLRGRRAETFGGLWNYDIGPLVGALSPDEYSWPRSLQQAGYSSSYLGKWHVNPDFDPTAFGYDEYVPESAYDESMQTGLPTSAQGIPKRWTDWHGAPSPDPVESSRTHWLADQASERVRALSNRRTPWHIRVDFSEPHLPCRPSEPFASMYPPASVRKWSNFDDPLIGKPYIQRQQRVNWHVEDMQWEDWAPGVARYLSMISQLDDALGRILRTVQDAGVADETVVVYTTDHGDLCGAHGMLDKHHVMYEEVVRVPLIMRWPAKIAAGTVVEDFVYNMLDIGPTIVDACGTEPAPDFQGRSLFAAIEGRDANPRSEVISTYNGQQFGLYSQRMLRTNEWKYIWNGTDVDELYDMKEDPAELVNLSGDVRYRSVLGELRSRLYFAMKSSGDSLFLNPWLESQLLENRKL